MKALQELKETVKHLRSPEGCPWDREQTHSSLCDHLIEECAELLDTIDRGDTVHMREELGDLLLHIFLHAQMEEEIGHFGIEDVARDINEKLIRRHPHVFGDAKVSGEDELWEQWERIKSSEKKNGVEQKGVLKNLPPRLPALSFARDVYKQIAKKELKVDEMLDEDTINALSDGLDEELAGGMLFDLASACYRMGIDPESALRRFTSDIVEQVEAEYGKGL